MIIISPSTIPSKAFNLNLTNVGSICIVVCGPGNVPISTENQIDLSGNQIAALPSSAVFNLAATTYTTLNMSGNQLSAVPSNAFVILSPWITIDFSGNQIKNLIPGAFNIPSIAQQIAFSISNFCSATEKFYLFFTRYNIIGTNQFGVQPIDGHPIECLQFLAFGNPAIRQFGFQ